MTDEDIDTMAALLKTLQDASSAPPAEKRKRLISIPEKTEKIRLVLHRKRRPVRTRANTKYSTVFQ